LLQLEALTSEKRCLCVMAEAIWPAALGSLTLVISKVHSDNELLQAPPPSPPTGHRRIASTLALAPPAPQLARVRTSLKPR
jgi:hypothetical protein